MEETAATFAEFMASSERQIREHHARHRSALSEWEVESDAEGFIDAQSGNVELIRVDYPEGLAAIHLRWDFRDLEGGRSICREAGVWVYACATCVQPMLDVPGTQKGRGNYPSQLYANAIVSRPDAIFCFYGEYTRPVVAFESRELDSLKRITKSEFEGARDNLKRLREYSRTALRTALLGAVRHPRYVIDPRPQLRYPPPRLSPLLKRHDKIRWPTFVISPNQFPLYLDDLDRDLALDESRHERGLRLLPTPSFALYDRRIGENIYTGTWAIAGGADALTTVVDMTKVDEANDYEADGLELEEETIVALEREEEAQRKAEEEEDERVAITEAEEERRRIEEEESEALYQLEEEEYYSRPNHDDCHWDEDREQMLTEDGDDCPHSGD